MDEQTARKLVEGYSPGGTVSAADYAIGIKQAFRYGEKNLPAADMLRSGYVSRLTAGQRTAAYEAGQRAGQQAAREEQKALAGKKKSGGQGGSVKFRQAGKVTDLRNHLKKSGRTLNATQETAVRTMEQLSAALGIDLYVYESYENDQGKRVYLNGDGKEAPAPNGQYYEGGRICIDLNAGMGGRGTMLYTVAHELTHFIREWSPEKFKILADVLMEGYAFEGRSVSALVEAQIEKARKNGRTIDFDTAFEEVVADSMENVLTSGNVVQMMADLKQQDKGLWEKIRDWFRELAADIRALVEAYRGHRPDSAEGRMVAQMREVLPVLEQFYADALADAADSYKKAPGAEKNTTREGGVKYSQRYLDADTNAEILDMVNKVANGDFKANEKVYLGTVTEAIADQINHLTGIRVNGFKVAIEARQIDHILKGHGANGDSDQSMADPNDIAKMEYALGNPDEIRKAGKTQAYTYMRNGRNRTADTVLYEKEIGTKSYYVVQAVPDTKARTLYIVTAFIGNSGYKKEAPQLINAKGPDATAKTGSVNASTNNIRNDGQNVNKKFSMRDPEAEKAYRQLEKENGKLRDMRELKNHKVKRGECR